MAISITPNLLEETTVTRHFAMKWSTSAHVDVHLLERQTRACSLELAGVTTYKSAPPRLTQTRLSLTRARPRENTGTVRSFRLASKTGVGTT